MLAQDYTTILETSVRTLCQKSNPDIPVGAVGVVVAYLGWQELDVVFVKFTEGQAMFPPAQLASCPSAN